MAREGGTLRGFVRSLQALDMRWACRRGKRGCECGARFAKRTVKVALGSKVPFATREARAACSGSSAGRILCSLGVRDSVDVEREAQRQRLPERNAPDPEAIGRFLKSVSIASLRVTRPTSRA